MQPALPNDILFLIIDNIDTNTLYQMAFTCKNLSDYALRLLWSRPYISKSSVLLKLVDTLNYQTSSNNYQQWITSLAIHIDFEKQPFPFAVFSTLKTLHLQVISFQYLSTSNASHKSQFIDFMCTQLDQKITEIHFYNCSTGIIDSTFESIQAKTRDHLTSLSIYECSFITDSQIMEVTKYCPNLRSLRLLKSGYFSDLSLMSVAHHCRYLNTLIVTLPSNIIQSNMITMDTINALKRNCHQLEQFFCPGQTRVYEYLLKCNNNLMNDITQ